MIDLALVDDAQLVRAGFRMVIDSQDDLHVVLEAGDGAQAVRALAGATGATPHVDVVLMDVRMPTMDGLTATAQITARGDAPKVVVLTPSTWTSTCSTRSGPAPPGYSSRTPRRRRCSPRSALGTAGTR